MAGLGQGGLRGLHYRPWLCAMQLGFAKATQGPHGRGMFGVVEWEGVVDHGQLWKYWSIPPGIFRTLSVGIRSLGESAVTYCN